VWLPPDCKDVDVLMFKHNKGADVMYYIPAKKKKKKVNVIHSQFILAYIFWRGWNGILKHSVLHMPISLPY
jgi:hypothetical protein